ncbi:hypothetical protein TOPH_03822 [Tolypocladium ophioglossoides CBS 100239]|uniref:Beta-lactamase-related domain-containing protein n=1 Tax=Tolypocladium ophioglossoides (strain CBS 100239) TaxID=1163406 RepID=A0A0L0NC73_TOLOC|nr:hypothetical protein TOPH_03822 [Tolypocladium ophioglossoides CBS 100239]
MLLGTTCIGSPRRRQGARLLSGEKRLQRLDDVLYLASTTKLTTVAALQCVEGALLTGNLSSVAPELAAKQVITDFSDQGASSSALCGKEAWSRRRSSYPLGFQPDGPFGGAGDGPSRERIQQRIFDPLGIADAQFDAITREDLHAHLIGLIKHDSSGLGRTVLGSGDDINKRKRGDAETLAATACSCWAPTSSRFCARYWPATRRLSPQATVRHPAALASLMGVCFRVGIDLETKMGHGLGGLLTLQDVDGRYGERTLTWGGGITLTWFIDRNNGLCGAGAVMYISRGRMRRDGIIALLVVLALCLAPPSD